MQSCLVFWNWYSREYISEHSQKQLSDHSYLVEWNVSLPTFGGNISVQIHCYFKNDKIDIINIVYVDPDVSQITKQIKFDFPSKNTIIMSSEGQESVGLNHDDLIFKGYDEATINAYVLKYSRNAEFLRRLKEDHPDVFKKQVAKSKHIMSHMDKDANSILEILEQIVSEASSYYLAFCKSQPLTLQNVGRGQYQLEKIYLI